MAFSRRRWQPRAKIEDEDEFEDEEKGSSRTMKRGVPHSKLWLTGQGFA
jgi:hypothetical protein